MGEVSSPPYDVFTSEIRRSFYERHPLNIVRLIQGETLEGEDGDAGRVGRAVEYLKQWRGSGQMTLDDTPRSIPTASASRCPMERISREMRFLRR